MPKRHHKDKRGDWTTMLSEQGARARIERESPAVAKVLDFFSTRMASYDGQGWTVFNDWLDLGDQKHYRTRPESTPYVPVDSIRKVVFPTRR